MSSKVRIGYKAENYVRDYFKKQGFEVISKPNYYDLLVKKNGKTKRIEVKSCHLMINLHYNYGNSIQGYGRFDFSNPENRVLQRKNNVDVCFLVGIKRNFEILGFISAKSLDLNVRYLPLVSVISKRLYRKESYVKRFDK